MTNTASFDRETRSTSTRGSCGVNVDVGTESDGSEAKTIPGELDSPVAHGSDQSQLSQSALLLNGRKVPSHKKTWSIFQWSLWLSQNWPK